MVDLGAMGREMMMVSGGGDGGDDGRAAHWGMASPMMKPSAMRWPIMSASRIVSPVRSCSFTMICLGSISSHRRYWRRLENVSTEMVS